MATAQTRCPHCATVQPFAGNSQLRCDSCAGLFYPTPIQDAAGNAVRRTRRRRGVQTVSAAAASARFWYFVRAVGAVILFSPMAYAFMLQLQADPSADGLTRTEGRLIIALGGVLLALGQIYLSRARAALGDDEPTK